MEGEGGRKGGRERGGGREREREREHPVRKLLVSHVILKD